MKLTFSFPKIKKGGAGSGHHGHAGRPGKKGGSVSGGSIRIIPYSRSDLRQEDTAAKKTMAELGMGSYSGGLFGGVSTYSNTADHSDVVKYYPKLVHNGKISLSKVLNIGYSRIDDVTAYRWEKGLYTDEDAARSIGLTSYVSEIT